MRRFLIRTLICFALLLPLQSYVWFDMACAGEKEERIQALQEKMTQLKGMLAELEEQKLREQPPEEIPWQPLISRGEERRAYTQYAYLLAPQMRQESLSAALEQLYYTAARDGMSHRGTLFVIPALNQTEAKQLEGVDYNRGLAADLLGAVGIPSAVSGGLLVTSDPIGKQARQDRPMLYLDLDGCSPMLRARIFELLLVSTLDESGASLYSFIGNLVAAAKPQVFQLYQQQQILWLSVVPE